MVFSSVSLGACLLAVYSAILLNALITQVNQYQDRSQQCIQNDPQIMGVYTDQQGITFDCALVCHPVNKDALVENYCRFEEYKYFSLKLAALGLPYVFLLMGLCHQKY